MNIDEVIASLKAGTSHSDFIGQVDNSRAFRVAPVKDNLTSIHCFSGNGYERKFSAT